MKIYFLTSRVGTAVMMALLSTYAFGGFCKTYSLVPGLSVKASPVTCTTCYEMGRYTFNKYCKTGDPACETAVIFDSKSACEAARDGRFNKDVTYCHEVNLVRTHCNKQETLHKSLYHSISLAKAKQLCGQYSGNSTGNWKAMHCYIVEKRMGLCKIHWEAQSCVVNPNSDIIKPET